VSKPTEKTAGSRRKPPGGGRGGRGGQGPTTGTPDEPRFDPEFEQETNRLAAAFPKLLPSQV